MSTPCPKSSVMMCYLRIASLDWTFLKSGGNNWKNQEIQWREKGTGNTVDFLAIFFLAIWL